jgi:hypothetical protein
MYQQRDAAGRLIGQADHRAGEVTVQQFNFEAVHPHRSVAKTMTPAEARDWADGIKLEADLAEEEEGEREV